MKLSSVNIILASNLLYTLNLHYFILFQRNLLSQRNSAPYYPTSGKWLPAAKGNSVIIVINKADYSEIIEFIEEKDLHHQVFNEVWH